MDRHLRELLEAAVGEPPRRVSAEAVRRRVIRRRVMECVAAAAAVAAIAALVPLGIRALDRAHRPSGPSHRRHAAASIFTSPEYGYTEALPPGWRSNGPARQRWDGKGAPAGTDSVTDLFVGPGGVEAWVIAAPTRENLAAYTTTTIRAVRAGHPCSAPQANQAITIAGAPARLLSMQCPPRSGFLVEIAVTIHNGVAFVFASQNPSGTAPDDQPADRAAFHTFLTGIRLRR